MFFFLKKVLFKFMELGLGLRTCFSLETRDPIFVNFKLTPEEADRVRQALPMGFKLCPIRFAQSDGEPNYWISYNLYELKYPKKELQRIRKARCEINTFVEDRLGRKGIYVFSGSPFVSEEKSWSVVGVICDFAERLVTFIYGCGKLIPLRYDVTADSVGIHFTQGDNHLRLDAGTAGLECTEALSSDYWRFNDISFFNQGKSFDLVNVGNSFYAARFQKIEGGDIDGATAISPFFGAERRPDVVYLHRGEIAYLVNSLNRMPSSARGLTA